MTQRLSSLSGAVDALGWGQAGVCPVDLFGLKVHAAYVFDAASHCVRTQRGLLPAADPGLLHCHAVVTADWETLRVVTVAGILVPRTSWSAARRVGQAFRGIAPAAVVLPKERVRESHSEFAHTHGFGLVASTVEEQYEVIQSGPAWNDQGRTWIRRLAEEIVYDAALRSDDLPEQWRQQSA